MISHISRYMDLSYHMISHQLSIAADINLESMPYQFPETPKRVQNLQKEVGKTVQLQMHSNHGKIYYALPEVCLAYNGNQRY